MQLEEADLRRIVALLEEQAEPAPDGEMRINYDGFAQVCVGGGGRSHSAHARDTHAAARLLMVVSLTAGLQAC